MVDNIGMPISGINMAYNNTGVDRPAGRRHPDQAEGRPPRRPRSYVRTLREELPRALPRHRRSAFLPADIVSQILNFGAPAPIDCRSAAPNLAANFAYANQLLRRIRHIPGIADARIQQSRE